MSIQSQQDIEIQVRPAAMPPLTLPDLSLILNQPTGMAGHLLFLFNLTRETGARHVVEIGLGGANSSLPFLMALRETAGSLTSIDVQCLPEAEQRIKNLGEQHRWKFIQASSDDAIHEVRQLAPIDILMIDGLHSYNQCRRDYFNYAPLVRPGGYILLHDSSAIMGVIEFTNELAARRLGGVNLDYCNGLYLFQKQNDVIW